MSNATYKAQRYDAFFRSLHWCEADPGAGLDAEPDACGPSIEALVTSHRPSSANRHCDFDARWSPNAIYFQDRRKPLDFN